MADSKMAFPTSSPSISDRPQPPTAIASSPHFFGELLPRFPFVEFFNFLDRAESLSVSRCCGKGFVNFDAILWFMIWLWLVWNEFVWGALAGAFGEGVMHPIDTIKTRVQSQAVIGGYQVTSLILPLFLSCLPFGVAMLLHGNLSRSLLSHECCCQVDVFLFVYLC